MVTFPINVKVTPVARCQLDQSAAASGGILIRHTSITLLSNFSAFFKAVVEINIKFKFSKMSQESWECNANTQVASAPGPQVG